MTDLTPICVPPDKAPQVWPLALRMIESAMARSKLSSFLGIQDDVLNGNALLWVLWDGKKMLAVAVTQIVTNEWGRDCTLVAFSGDIDAALPFLEVIEDYAHAMECRVLRILGPEAYMKILPADYLKTAVVLEKVI